jgi:hypothetical protein
MDSTLSPSLDRLWARFTSDLRRTNELERVLSPTGQFWAENASIGTSVGYCGWTDLDSGVVSDVCNVMILHSQNLGNNTVEVTMKGWIVDRFMIGNTELLSLLRHVPRPVPRKITVIVGS